MSAIELGVAAAAAARCFIVLRHMFRFPRVSMCDFKIRQNTNVHRYTVQCVLPINIFNEKIFTIVWFWLLIVGAVTVVGLLTWLCQLTYWPAQYRYVRRQLGSVVALSSATHVAAATVGLTLTDPGCKTDMRRFADVYLRRDGLFVLRLVAKNAGDLVSTELLAGLWNAYNLSHRQTLPTGTNNGSTIRGLLRPNRKSSKGGRGNEHHVVDMATSPKTEDI